MGVEVLIPLAWFDGCRTPQDVGRVIEEAREHATPKCPACGSKSIVATYDFMHDTHILKCDECGEMYAVSGADNANLTRKQIMDEWNGNYESTRRLV